MTAWTSKYCSRQKWLGLCAWSSCFIQGGGRHGGCSSTGDRRPSGIAFRPSRSDPPLFPLDLVVQVLKLLCYTGGVPPHCDGEAVMDVETLDVVRMKEVLHVTKTDTHTHTPSINTMYTLNRAYMAAVRVLRPKADKSDCGTYTVLVRSVCISLAMMFSPLPGTNSDATGHQIGAPNHTRSCSSRGHVVDQLRSRAILYLSH